jgi:hypothetical protein
MSIRIFSQQQEDPKDTEVWVPIPEVVTPGEGTQAPSDAIVLFGGKDASEWVNEEEKAIEWTVADGCMTVVKGAGTIQTKREFGDIQLHIEWRSPQKIEGEGQGRGNSGIFLQKRYEVQVLDSYKNKTYSNGQAGSIYKQHIPLVNACRPPGEWQTYDIFYEAPRFDDEGELEKPAYITVVHNGILVQNHVKIKGLTVFRGRPYYKNHLPKAPLMLQDHGNPVSFRNIWVREL